MTHICLEAAERLAADNVSAEVVDVLSLAPLDEETILESVRRTHRLVVVDEDHPVASMARDIAAIVADKAFDWLDAPVKTVTAPIRRSRLPPSSRRSTSRMLRRWSPPFAPSLDRSIPWPARS